MTAAGLSAARFRGRGPRYSPIMDFREECPIRRHTPKVRHIVRSYRGQTNAVAGPDDLESAGFAAVWRCIEENRTDDKHLFAMIAWAVSRELQVTRRVRRSSYYRALEAGRDPHANVSERVYLSDEHWQNVRDLADEEPRVVQLEALAPFHKRSWFKAGQPMPEHVVEAVRRGLDAGMTNREVACALGLNSKSLSRMPVVRERSGAAPYARSATKKRERVA